MGKPVGFAESIFDFNGNILGNRWGCFEYFNGSKNLWNMSISMGILESEANPRVSAGFPGSEVSTGFCCCVAAWPKSPSLLFQPKRS